METTAKPPFLHDHDTHEEFAAGFGWKPETLSAKKSRGDIKVDALRVGNQFFYPPGEREKVRQQLIERAKRRRGRAA